MIFSSYPTVDRGKSKVPRILVDADSMPARHRAIILRRAMKENIVTTFVADRRLGDVEEAMKAHTTELRSPLRDTLGRDEIRKVRTTISMIVVESGTNAADDRIVELSGPDCIVISHDIPLLARALEKGARAMDDRGGVYSSENIRVRLGERDVNSILREMKVFEDRSRPFDNKQLEAFANCLDRMLVNHT